MADWENKMQLIKTLAVECMAETEEDLWVGCCRVFNAEWSTPLPLAAFKIMMSKFGYSTHYSEDHTCWFFRNPEHAHPLEVG